jgi:hypothetical protein
MWPVATAGEDDSGWLKVKLVNGAGSSMFSKVSRTTARMIKMAMTTRAEIDCFGLVSTRSSLSYLETNFMSLTSFLFVFRLSNQVLSKAGAGVAYRF